MAEDALDVRQLAVEVDALIAPREIAAAGERALQRGEAELEVDGGDLLHLAGALVGEAQRPVFDPHIINLQIALSAQS